MAKENYSYEFVTAKGMAEEPIEVPRFYHHGVQCDFGEFKNSASPKLMRKYVAEAYIVNESNHASAVSWCE